MNPTLPKHDHMSASYSPHSSDFGKALVFDTRCRRCWYDKAKAEDNALLEAVKATLEFVSEWKALKRANAGLIVQAVNSHTLLLEAAKAALEFMSEWDAQQHVVSGLGLMLNEAIVAAEGGT